MLCVLCRLEIVCIDLGGASVWVHLNDDGDLHVEASLDHDPLVPAELPEPLLEHV